MDGRDGVTQKTMLKFTWSVIADDFREACEVRLRCDNAMRRGVHMPQAWKGNIGVHDMDALADLAVRRAQDEFALSHATKLDCRYSLE